LTRVGFGAFTFDGEQQELRRGAERIHLTPKVMCLLELLLERRGSLVTHVEIHDRLWPDVVVSEANLKNVVSELRGALDDHQREGRFIRNVYDRGYLFTEEVSEAERCIIRAHLQLDGRSLPLCDGAILVGRGDDCAIVLHDESVSRHHARIAVSADTIVIEDLDSKNGTLVDGVRLERSRVLEGTHKITFGRTVAWYTCGAQNPSTATLSGE
jgi:DNA-binding winged helix-turn-helix (wHTH) protein